MTRPARIAFAVALLGTIACTAKAAANDVEVERVETIYRFQNDGTGQMTVHARWKALTAAGVPAVTQFSIPFASEFEGLTNLVFQNGQEERSDARW